MGVEVATRTSPDVQLLCENPIDKTVDLMSLSKNDLNFNKYGASQLIALRLLMELRRIGNLHTKGTTVLGLD